MLRFSTPPLSGKSLTWGSSWDFEHAFFEDKKGWRSTTNNVIASDTKGGARQSRSGFCGLLRHFIPRNDGRAFAFTLAEVLITLVIIGVIAALTIPNLYAKFQKKTLSSQLKMTYSLLSNSINSLGCKQINPDWVQDIDNRQISSYSKEERIKDFETCIVGNLKRTKNFGYIVPGSRYGFKYQYKTLNGAITAPQTGTGTYFYTMILANGSYLFLYLVGSNDGTATLPYIFVDVNGSKGPNILGKDLFLFVLDRKATLTIPGAQYTREKIVSECTTEGGSYYAIMCSALAQKDGWEFKDDYPW